MVAGPRTGGNAAISRSDRQHRPGPQRPAAEAGQQVGRPAAKPRRHRHPAARRRRRYAGQPRAPRSLTTPPSGTAKLSPNGAWPWATLRTRRHCHRRRRSSHRQGQFAKAAERGSSQRQLDPGSSILVAGQPVSRDQADLIRGARRRHSAGPETRPSQILDGSERPGPAYLKAPFWRLSAALAAFLDLLPH